jgi:hypothetical protein
MATYILKKELKSFGIPSLLLVKPALLPEHWAHMLAPVIWSLGPGLSFHRKNQLHIERMPPLGKVNCVCQKFKSALNFYMALFANQLKVVSRRELHCLLSPNFETFKERKNRFQGVKSASLCSLSDRYDNPIPTRFLAPIDCLKIPALITWSEFSLRYKIIKVEC